MRDPMKSRTMKSRARVGLPAALVLVLLAASLMMTGACARSPAAGFSDDETTIPAFDAASPGACEQAAAAKSYVGCDYWPTVTANLVWSIFDYAVVVANASAAPADVVVERDGKPVSKARIEPNALAKIYLPWVAELKGADADSCGNGGGVPAKTSLVKNGAYHLTSTVPVSVYQFNALEYAPTGGPPDKNWSSCPGFSGCKGTTCLSYSNDASLLLPSTALTGTYRVMGFARGTPFLTITGLVADTKVTVALSATAQTLAGDGIAAGTPSGALELRLGRGDVAQVMAPRGNVDLSGSLVRADHPVQVITGSPCVTNPEGAAACDHLESALFPAETLGKHYVVTQPTGPRGVQHGHVVRLYGNADGTKLTYPSGAPKLAPEHIGAGEVIDLGVVDTDFEVVGDHELGVGSFMLGGSIVDPERNFGDPSQSFFVPVEQHLQKYVFLAPDDYEISFADVVQPLAAKLVLDGAPVTTAPVPIGTSSFGVARIRLSATAGGAHVLTSDVPVGLQVLGYGDSTSYQYPGGLNLTSIAPPPR